jgi:hypothetical protein
MASFTEEETKCYFVTPSYKKSVYENLIYTKYYGDTRVSLKVTKIWRYGEFNIEMSVSESKEIIKLDEVNLNNYCTEVICTDNLYDYDAEIVDINKYDEELQKQINLDVFEDVDNETPYDDADLVDEHDWDLDDTLYSIVGGVELDKDEDSPDESGEEEDPNAFECDDCNVKDINCFEHFGISKEEVDIYRDMGEPDRCTDCFEKWKNGEDGSEYLKMVTDNDKEKTYKLCENVDCERYPPDWDSESDTESTYQEGQWKKCCLCDGYFDDDGFGDILFVQEEPNNQEAECDLCGKTKDIVQMKGSGQYLCEAACDEDEDEEDKEEKEEKEEEEDADEEQEEKEEDKKCSAYYYNVYRCKHCDCTTASDDPDCYICGKKCCMLLEQVLDSGDDKSEYEYEFESEPDFEDEDKTDNVKEEASNKISRPTFSPLTEEQLEAKRQEKMWDVGDY